jgi:sirohydrochlorin cobaltochelatase
MFLCAAVCRAQDIPSERALLMVHFGTTYDDTRQKTIDAINQKAREQFPKMAVREAYTSRIVMKRLAQRGVVKDTPVEAMLRLRGEGYKTLVVQPTFVIDGKEMAELRRDVDRLRPFFDSITVSTPLLYGVGDCQRVCDVLVARHHADAKKREHVVFVGHGTEGPATALYSQIDYQLAAGGHPNYHVATIEGYPTQETAVSKIKAMKGRRVTLVPLLFVAGDHASNDIAVEWRAELERQGLTVDVRLEGLGEVPEIQQLYLEKLKP